jgi:hypothetical protein
MVSFLTTDRVSVEVIRDRVETPASPAMSAVPPKAEVSYPTATQHDGCDRQH